MTKRKVYYKVINAINRCSAVQSLPGWITKYPKGKTVKAKFGSLLFIFENYDDALVFSSNCWRYTKVVKCHASGVKKAIYSRYNDNSKFTQYRSEENTFWKNTSTSKSKDYCVSDGSWPEGTLFAKEVTCLE